MEKVDKDIGFLDSFAADTAIVPEVISKLIIDLNEAAYPQDEIDEIVLSMDEASTNAVQETINKNSSKESLSDRREITIRYTVGKKEFDATIIDHGKGLDLFNIMNTVPDNKSNEYHQQIISYASESERKKIKVRVNNIEIPLKGIGAGLKIILNFMDSVTIDLIDKEKVLSPSVSEHTDGTIFNMKRNRRY
jgi:anti-sigma regulatory factor (Ser/Thr protein kinase)